MVKYYSETLTFCLLFVSLLPIVNLTKKTNINKKGVTCNFNAESYLLYILSIS